MVISDTQEQQSSNGEQQALVNFYKIHNLPYQNIHTTNDVLNRSLALIDTTDWLAGQEKLSDYDSNIDAIMNILRQGQEYYR